MEIITRVNLQAMMRDQPDLKVIEVLSPDEYAKSHIVGALNVPLSYGFDQQIKTVVPKKDEPVVVYCANSDCDASPKAAKRMEQLGYRNVYDYAAGKEDWRAAGLPVE